VPDLEEAFMRAGAALVVGISALALTACGAGSAEPSGSAPAATTSNRAVTGTISFDGVWTGQEAQHFRAVIAAFHRQYPRVNVQYRPVGDNLPTVLATAIAGGRPPDMADIAQPGLVKQFAARGVLKPISYARPALARNFKPSWLKLGTFNGKLYGSVFKASNKSTVWYSVPAFRDAGVKPPATWAQLLARATTIRLSGTPPYAIGGADGWTLTDLFENIYLRQAGAAKYDQLSAHKIKWTDTTVTAALRTMAQIVGNGANIAGGRSGALQTDFPTSVNDVFQNPPKAAIVFEGDFVPGVATVKAKAGTGYGEFAFPSIDGSGPAVEIGGDTIVTFRDTPAIRAFVNFLATPQAGAAWARFGGFATGNTKMSTSVYPDAITRKTASAIADAKNVAFDMSDQQPSAFGATVGQGEWGLFQSFLRNPSNVGGIQRQLEAAATAAYRNGTQ
jgi:alpha-glucoside transport system substrate-binding protein